MNQFGRSQPQPETLQYLHIYASSLVVKVPSSMELHNKSHFAGGFSHAADELVKD